MSEKDELAHLVNQLGVEQQLDQAAPDPDLTDPEPPGVAAVRERLEEPFEYAQDVPQESPPNAEGYA